MRVVPLLALLALVTVGCASPSPHAGRAADRGDRFGGADRSDRTVRYACTRGETVELRFGPDIAVLVRNGRALELRQQPAASGFVYSNGPNTIRGKGNELVVEIGRMAPLQCTRE